MSTRRTLPVLLCLLVTLVLAQQLFARRRFQSSESQLARDRSHITMVTTNAELAEREKVREGELWIGSLFDDTEPSAPDELEHSEFRPSPRSHRIGGTFDFEHESLSVNLDLHECQPGSSLCATGGTMTVFAGDQPLCVISVGILQPQSDGLPTNHYRVEWHAREDGFSFDDADRISILGRLAGTASIPNRSGFLQLLRVGYADESPEASASTDEPIEKQLIRAICTAIVHSRTLKPSE